MDGSSPCFERLMGLKISSDLNIRSIVKDVVKMVGSFYCSSRYLTSTAILYLFIRKMKTKSEYCYHILPGVVHFSVACLGNDQKRLHGFVGD